MIAPAGGSPTPGFSRVLRYTPAARRGLGKLPNDAARAAVEALEHYAATGAEDVRRLVGGRPPKYRLRVGDDRALHSRRHGHGATVLVLWVGNRREAY